MIITSIINILVVDGVPIKQFAAPIEAAFIREGIIVVLLNGPHDHTPFSEERRELRQLACYAEGDRNVYGVTPDGIEIWRLERMRGAYPASSSVTRIFTFGRRTVIEQDGDYYHELDVSTGCLTPFDFPIDDLAFRDVAALLGEPVEWHPFTPRGSSGHEWPPNITLEEASNILLEETKK